MGFRTRARGIAQRAVPWLQIPIHADFHIGRFGIDSGTGVLTWESSFGAQADLLDEVDHILAYPVSIWTLAEQWDHDHRGKSLPWSE